MDAIEPARIRRGPLRLGILSTVILAVLVACGQEVERSDLSAGVTTTRDVTPTSLSVPTTTTTIATTIATTVPPPTTAAPAPPTTVAPSAVMVERVVDGDTIDLVGGESVRLIGIDTPEVGECGFAEAAGALRWLIGGRSVVLVPGARVDRDRYGRLLRYLEIGGADLNLLMIRSGRAIARYDSRDGYGRHSREGSYVAADGASPSANGCGPVGPPSTLAPGVGGMDPRFGSCREARANGFGPYVDGPDPEYGWYRDGDGDGTVCE